MAKNGPTKIVSKKHLARLERERRQTKLITFIAIVVIAAVILLIGYGILNETVLVNRQPIVTVNGESTSVREFQVRVRATRQWLINQYFQLYQFAQMLGVDPSTDQSMSSQLQQITSQLDTPSMMGSQVIVDITDDLLIRQYAKANGIVVTAEDVDKAIQNEFGLFLDGTPTPTMTVAPFTYSTLSATQNALMTPTITSTPGPTRTLRPTLTPDLTATAMPTPLATPTATPYTLDGFQQQYKDELNKYKIKLGMTEDEFRKIYYESRLYRERVTAVITKDVPHEQEQVWARHILVTDEATAKIIRQQLIDGVDFGVLAAQYSLDTGNKDTGGDLGWFGSGKMVAEFEKAAFALKVGEISEPVQTSFGWHIIQVLGREFRPLTEIEYKDAVTAAFTEWLLTQNNASKIETAKNWIDLVPDRPTLQDAYNDVYSSQTAAAPTIEAMQTANP